MSETCKKCGRTLAQSLECGYCYALANPPAPGERAQNKIQSSDFSESDWQEACNPNEGSK